MKHLLIAVFCLMMGAQIHAGAAEAVKKEKKDPKVVVINGGKQQNILVSEIGKLPHDSIQTIDVLGDSMIIIRMKPAKAPASAKKKTK